MPDYIDESVQSVYQMLKKNYQLIVDLGTYSPDHYYNTDFSEIYMMTNTSEVYIGTW